MSELAQIGVTEDNRKCLDILKESGYFDELQEAARFAASLAIRKELYKGIKLNSYGTNFVTGWNTSLVDPDYFFRNFIKAYDLCPEDYGVGLRSLINIGLDYIYNKVKNNNLVSISELLK